MHPSTTLFESTFRHALKQLPKLEVVSIDTGLRSVHVQKNTSYQIVGRDTAFAMTTVSTYPIVADIKHGEPNADCVAISRYRNATFAVVCDGCGWGARSAAASRTATEASLEFFNNNSAVVTTPRTLGRLLVQTASHAHGRIIEHNMQCQIGTTTILLAATVELVVGGTYSVVLSIGDCLAMLYMPASGHLSTVAGRWRKTHATNSCGGRIGINPPKNLPELVNSELVGVRHGDGELFLLSTDGFHDNIDATLTGKQPKDVLLPILRESSSLLEVVERAVSYIIDYTAPLRAKLEEPSAPRRRCEDVTPKLDHTSLVVYNTTPLLVDTHVNLIIPACFEEIHHRSVLPYANRVDDNELRKTRSSSLTFGSSSPGRSGLESKAARGLRAVSGSFSGGSLTPRGRSAWRAFALGSLDGASPKDASPGVGFPGARCSSACASPPSGDAFVSYFFRMPVY